MYISKRCNVICITFLSTLKKVTILFNKRIINFFVPFLILFWNVSPILLIIYPIISKFLVSKIITLLVFLLFYIFIACIFLYFWTIIITYLKYKFFLKKLDNSKFFMFYLIQSIKDIIYNKKLFFITLWSTSAVVNYFFISINNNNFIIPNFNLFFIIYILSIVFIINYINYIFSKDKFFSKKNLLSFIILVIIITFWKYIIFLFYFNFLNYELLTLNMTNNRSTSNTGNNESTSTALDNLSNPILPDNTSQEQIWKVITDPNNLKGTAIFRAEGGHRTSASLIKLEPITSVTISEDTIRYGIEQGLSGADTMKFLYEYNMALTAQRLGYIEIKELSLQGLHHLKIFPNNNEISKINPTILGKVDNIFKILGNNPYHSIRDMNITVKDAKNTFILARDTNDRLFKDYPQVYEGNWKYLESTTNYPEHVAKLREANESLRSRNTIRVRTEFSRVLNRTEFSANLEELEKLKKIE